MTMYVSPDKLPSCSDNEVNNNLVAAITDSLPGYLNNSGKVKLQVNAEKSQYDSIIFDVTLSNSPFRGFQIPQILICRVKRNTEKSRTEKYVSFASQFESLFSNHFSIQEAKADGFFRISFFEFYNFIITHPDAGLIIEKIILSTISFPPFDCCSKYMECSNEKRCLHSDILYSTACTYRKKLEKGIIYYGKNRNVDTLTSPAATIDLSKVNKDRAGKGKSLIAFPLNYVIVDVETTGLSPLYDEIIEIAAIKVINGCINEVFSTLVKPSHEIDFFITQLTGISNEMVQDAPNIAEALNKFLPFVSDSIIVGHNVNFDINFIYEACSEIGIVFSNDYIDTMRLARKILPELPHHRLIDLVEFFSIESDVYHRALADCEYTFKCYRELERELNVRNLTVEELQPKKKKRTIFSHQLDARSIVSQNTEFDLSHPLYKKVCVFTGTLEKMKRADAMQLVVDLGGECANRVTKQTNFLILGNNDYCSTIKNGKSQKQTQAEAYKLQGYDIEIIPESVFYELIENE